jgi:thiol-disulfide isomerase/thioredoxin
MNYMYEPYIHKYKTNENQISINIPDSISFFLMDINSNEHNYNWGKNVIMYMDKGERLTIQIDTLIPPVFDGNKSDYYNFAFNLKNGTGNDRTLSTLQEYIDNNNTTSFFDFVSKEIETKSLYLNDLLNKNIIDEATTSFYNGIIVDDYLYRASNIARISTEDFLQKTDSASFYADVNRLFKRYSSTGAGYIHNNSKATLMAMGVIPSVKLDLGLDYENNPNIFLNKDEQEQETASNIITNTAAGSLDSTLLATHRNKFKQVFPRSIYIPILDALKPLEQKDFYLAKYSKDQGFEEYGRFKTNDLSQITQMFMGPKPVLADFWATWCAPCIKEFKYRAEVDKFLEENNIGMIFVSIDFPGSYEKWKEFIKKHELEGLHYFGTPKFAEQLPYLKGSTIPRYVLLDNKGKVLIDNCQFPSSGKLIPQIKKQLGI